MKINRLILVVLILFSSSVSASSTTNVDLQQQLLAFLALHQTTLAEKGLRSEFSIGNIDPRLRMRECSQTVDLSFNRDPMEQSLVTVLADCSDSDNNWKMYLNAEFKVFAKVAKSVLAIPRGTRLDESMLTLEETQINKGRYSSYRTLADITGMLAKRTIRAGSTISPNQLEAPKLIERGDHVVIIARSEFMNIKTQGTALSGGVLGQQISIRNNKSERVIKAQVIDKGRVSITL